MREYYLKFAQNLREKQKKAGKRHHTMTIPVSNNKLSVTEDIAEGRLVCDPGDAQKYMDAGCVALQYADNHNGSELRIAGLMDPTGRAMGLMPHPERFLKPRHHYDPDWSGDSEWGWGYYFFKGAFDALK